MGDMDLIPRQTKPHSLAEGSDVGRRFLSRLGPRASPLFQGLPPPREPGGEGGAAEGCVTRLDWSFAVVLGHEAAKATVYCSHQGTISWLHRLMQQTFKPVFRVLWTTYKMP